MNGLFVAGRCFGYNLGSSTWESTFAPVSCDNYVPRKHYVHRYVYGYRMRRSHSDSRRSTSHVQHCKRMSYRILERVGRLPIAASASAEKFGGVYINGGVWPTLTHSTPRPVCSSFSNLRTTLFTVCPTHVLEICSSNACIPYFLFCDCVCRCRVESLDVLHVDKLRNINNTSHGKLLKRI